MLQTNYYKLFVRTKAVKEKKISEILRPKEPPKKNKIEMFS